MRAKEFINESGTGELGPGVANELPAAFALPGLKSQDAYTQYRFGLALASARAAKNGDIDFTDESKFGEDMVIVARSKEEEETLKMALALYGKNNSSRQISSPNSQEASDVYHTSPLVANTRKYGKRE